MKDPDLSVFIISALMSMLRIRSRCAAYFAGMSGNDRHLYIGLRRLFCIAAELQPRSIIRGQFGLAHTCTPQISLARGEVQVTEGPSYWR